MPVPTERRLEPIIEKQVIRHPLDTLLRGTEKGKGHKAEGGTSLTTAQLESLNNNFISENPRYKFDPRAQGGLLFEGDKLVGAVLPPKYRRGEREQLGIHDIDIQKVYMTDKKDLRFESVNSGLEAEFFGFDPETGKMKSMMNKGDAFRKALEEYNKDAEKNGRNKIPFTVEMINNCDELTFPHGEARDPLKIHEEYLGILKELIQVAERSDVNIIIAPMANIPHRKIDPEDITVDKYTNDMTLKEQGWEAAQHFDIASIQPHIEIINHEAARYTLNQLQHVMPILFAPTLSGPFMEGELEPDVEERYADVTDLKPAPLKQATLEELQQGTHHSYRTFGRFFGSPSGGILGGPIPVKEQDYIEEMSRLLKGDDTNSVGRIGGHHTDRYRNDIPPHGTIELCALDPAVGRIQRVIAMREFTRVLGWKMQMHYLNGDMEQKMREFPALFAQAPSKESFEISHFNMMRVAKDGTNAVLKDVNGSDQEYSVLDLWQQLLEFTQEPLKDPKNNIDYKGISQGVIDEITKAFIDPNLVFDHYRDANGVVSSRGYQETGIGTASQWYIEHYNNQREHNGMQKIDAVRSNTMDAGKSFHTHVKETSIDELMELMGMAHPAETRITHNGSGEVQIYPI